MNEIVVVLTRTQGPVNLGLCARACANLGVSDLRLVEPLCEVDQPDARKFANHAKTLLLEAECCSSVSEAVADCDYVVGTSANRRQRGFIDPASPETLAPRLSTAGRIAVVFGNEADGLTNHELRACQSTLHLPTWGTYSSYNLSHAVAVTLYALRSRMDPIDPERSSPAYSTQDELEELTRLWSDVLDRFGYFRRTHRARFEPKLRAMIGRLRLARHDAGLLRGMLAHFDLHAPKK